MTTIALQEVIISITMEIQKLFITSFSFSHIEKIKQNKKQ